MRQATFVVVMVTVIVLFGFSVKKADAAAQFVQNMRTYRSGDTYLQLQWDTAECSTDDATLILQPVANSAAQISVTVATPTVLVGGVPQSGCEQWWVTLGPTQVAENTAYNFWVEFANGTTTNGTQLSTFVDYVSGSAKIVSAVGHTRSRNDSATVTSTSKTYIEPGDTFRVYGTGFGSGPSDLTTAFAHIGPNNPYIEQVLSGNYYNLPILAWTDTSIELQAPAYSASKLLQSGLIYFDDMVFDDANYEPQFFVGAVQSAGEIKRTVTSRLKGETYRYLVNATRYRYNVKRTTATHIEEGKEMLWLTKYMKKKGKQQDPLKSLIFVNAIVYGGYSRDEIKHEMFFGPGCVQTYIVRSEWSKTSQYTSCMSYALP